MPGALSRAAALALTGLLLMAGCAPHEAYRTERDLCTSADPEADCRRHALQEYVAPGEADRSYLLGFIELDDQGQLFDRGQMQVVFDGVFEAAAAQDLLIVVFVHGWKHNAAPGDDNIRTFRRSLERLSELESTLSRSTGEPERRTVGIYLGWRGASVTAPLLEEATFWERKSTAHQVGHGGITEVLGRLDLVKQTKDAIADPGPSRTRLVVVGHSFGGAAVYSALAQILANRFIHTVGPPGRVGDAQGFGNLVVLINPAFEALRFTPLADMSTERGTYFPNQLPVLAILTSEADDATRLAFPLGRAVSTLFEHHRDLRRRNGVTGEEEVVDGAKADITAVGHFEPYRTHSLRATGSGVGAAADAPVERAVRTFLAASRGWENDRPGSRIPFEGAVLERTEDSAGRNPYLVVRVDAQLIADHNDIDDPRIESFVRQLILIASQSADPRERASNRARARRQP